MYNPDKLKSVDLGQLRHYLQASNWVRFSDLPALYRSPGGKVIQIPRDLNRDEDFIALQVALHHLVTIDKTLTAQTFLTRLSYVDDFLFFGCEFPGTPPAQIPLGLAPAFYDGINKYTRQTIYAERNPSSDSQRRRLNKYLRDVRFGEVIESSYLVAIHLPLASHTQEAIGRKAWQRVIRCVESISEATARKSETPLIELKEGWTPAMIEAMGDFLEQTKVTLVKAHASPNPEWAGPKPSTALDAESPVVPGITLPAISAASAALRGLRERQEMTIEGRIFGIENKEIIGQGKMKSAQLRWMRADGSEINVVVEVEPGRYTRTLRALESHPFLRIKGMLEQRGVRWFMTDVQTIENADDLPE